MAFGALLLVLVGVGLVRMILGNVSVEAEET